MLNFPRHIRTRVPLNGGGADPSVNPSTSSHQNLGGKRPFTEDASVTVAQNVDLIEAEDRRKTKEIVDKINAQVGLNEAIEFLNDQTFSSPISFFLFLPRSHAALRS